LKPACRRDHVVVDRVGTIFAKHGLPRGFLANIEAIDLLVFEDQGHVPLQMAVEQSLLDGQPLDMVCRILDARSERRLNQLTSDAMRYISGTDGAVWILVMAEYVKATLPS
jgi:hypothetical protein